VAMAVVVGGVAVGATVAVADEAAPDKGWFTFCRLS
jgi:hypothetical protein